MKCVEIYVGGSDFGCVLDENGHDSSYPAGFHVFHMVADKV